MDNSAVAAILLRRGRKGREKEGEKRGRWEEKNEGRVRGGYFLFFI